MGNVLLKYGLVHYSYLKYNHCLLVKFKSYTDTLSEAEMKTELYSGHHSPHIPMGMPYRM